MKYRWLALLLGLLLLAGCGPTGSTARRGEVAPDFALEDLAGEQVRLSDFQGKPVLINFWASWCPPCRTEMPELQRAYTAGQGEPIILAVDALYQDDRQDVQEFIAELGLSFPILLDKDGAIAVSYRVGSLPTSVFVDRDGKIHLIQVGPMTQLFVESVLREMR